MRGASELSRSASLLQLYASLLPPYAMLLLNDVLLLALSKRRYLVPIAAGRHAAPPSMVGAGAIVEPEHALPVFAPPDEVEVACGKEFSRGLCERREYLLRGAALPSAFELQRATFGGENFEMAPALCEEGVQRLQVDGLACLAALDCSPDDFAKRTRGCQQRGGWALDLRLSRLACEREPLQHVGTALQGVDQLSVDHEDRIQKRERRMICEVYAGSACRRGGCVRHGDKNFLNDLRIFLVTCAILFDRLQIICNLYLAPSPVASFARPRSM